MTGWLWALVLALLLAQATWIFQDARRRGPRGARYCPHCGLELSPEGGEPSPRPGA